MAQGPNPKGKSHASHAVPSLHKLPVRSTPKVKARPNTVSQKGPSSGLTTKKFGGNVRPRNTD